MGLLRLAAREQDRRRAVLGVGRGRPGPQTQDRDEELRPLGIIYDLYKAKGLADQLKEHYESYPSSPDGFDQWQSERDDLMDEIYAVTGADAKY